MKFTHVDLVQLWTVKATFFMMLIESAFADGNYLQPIRNAAKEVIIRIVHD